MGMETNVGAVYKGKRVSRALSYGTLKGDHLLSLQLLFLSAHLSMVEECLRHHRTWSLDLKAAVMARDMKEDLFYYFSPFN